MAVEGKLALFPLPEILQVISQQRRSGILTLQGAADIIAVSFHQGRVVAADALNESAMDGLGGILVEEGRIAPDALQKMSARADAEGRRLADLLVEEAYVDRGQLLEALRLQTLRLLLSLLAWDEGDFKFYGGDEVSYEEGFRSIGVDELLLKAIEDESSSRARAVPTLDTRLRRLESDKPVVLRHARTLGNAPPPPDDGKTVWVTPDEQRILEAVSPSRTVAEVADEAGVTDDRARYVLFRLVRQGVVAAMGGTPPVSLETPARPMTAPARPDREPTERPERPERTTPAEPPAPSRAPVAAPGEGFADQDAPHAGSVVERPPSEAVGVRPLAVGAALLAAVLLVAALLVAPVSFFLPFPWQDGERVVMHARRDAAHLVELDRAAKTFFLLEGRFPDDLGELVDAGLLEPRDVYDSRGRRLSYESQERSYVVRPLVGDTASPGFEEGIAGNFLLDPEIQIGLRSDRDEAAEPPLILLD